MRRYLNNLKVYIYKSIILKNAKNSQECATIQRTARHQSGICAKCQGHTLAEKYQRELLIEL